MKLVRSDKPYGCMAASLSMVLDINIGCIEANLFSCLEYPFPGKWAHFPKVPDMNVICDWAWQIQRVGFVPFEKNPMCYPHIDCPAVPVWPFKLCGGSAKEAWNRALSFGTGLLEGLRPSRDLAHMCAWDGNVVYDPRGYAYSINVAEDKFDFEPVRFWLAVKAGK